MKLRIFFALAVVAVAALAATTSFRSVVQTAQAQNNALSTSINSADELDALNFEIALYESILAGDFDGASAAAAAPANCTGTGCDLPGSGGVGCGCVGSGGCTSGGSGSQSWVECDDGRGTKVRCTRNSNGQGCNCTRR